MNPHIATHFSIKKKANKNVIMLGWVSFFTDISSEMILPVLPLFLVSALGVGHSIIGLIEGVAESTSSLLKILSGWYSDRIRRRKPVALLGYSLSNVIKPVLALATAWSHVLTIRFIDRIGKGVRTAPRDALIAEASDRRSMGRSFGLHRMMDTAGAVIGASIAFAVLSLVSGGYRPLFLLSAIPGAIALLVLVICVREKRKNGLDEVVKKVLWSWDSFPSNFYRFIICISLFTFSSVSYAFFILRANELDIAVRFIPIIYLLYNLVYALCAFPAGILSDRIGKIPVLAFGMFVHGVLLFGFFAAKAAYHGWILFAAYGFVTAITDTIPRALVSDIIRSENRATALGLYHTAVGIIPLPANLLFGLVWSTYGSGTAFLVWAVLSLCAFAVFALHGSKFRVDGSLGMV